MLRETEGKRQRERESSIKIKSKKREIRKECKKKQFNRRNVREIECRCVYEADGEGS